MKHTFIHWFAGGAIVRKTYNYDGATFSAIGVRVFQMSHPKTCFTQYSQEVGLWDLLRRETMSDIHFSDNPKLNPKTP